MAPNNSPDRSNPDSPPSSSRPHLPTIQKLFDIPRAIYDHGTEHGREWQRRWECKRDARKSEWGGCDYKRRVVETSNNNCCSTPTTHKPTPLGSGKSSDDDWYAWTRKELQRGERRAQEMYDSWSEQSTPPKPSQSTPPKDDARGDSSWPWTPLELSIQWLFNHESLLDTEFDNLMRLHTSDLEAFRKSMNHRITGEIQKYAAYDEYSPTELERYRGFDKSWRNRFEDLIRVDAGVKMMDREEAEKARKDDNLSWLWRFAPIGEVPTPKQSTRRPFINRPEQMTELDMYEHFLSSSSQTPVSKDKDEPVTVERTVDSWRTRGGSIRTRETTRKTFADGRAEVFIAEDTLPEESSRGVETQAVPKETQPAQQPGTDRRSRGWFWSN